MPLLAKQPYVKIIREVSSITQTNTEENRMLYLYSDKVVTKHREFSMEDITDMSYRSIGENGGLLYIHTSSGVFSYFMKTSPKEFVHVFKEHRDQS